MGIYLFASVARGLFISMLVIMIVVCVLFGLMMFMLFKPAKKSGDDGDSVKKLLARRETALTVELVNNKDDEAKKAELVNKLRRVKSAQLLVDELVAEEQAVQGITEAEEKGRAAKVKAEKSRANGKSDGERKPKPAKPVPEKTTEQAEGTGEKPNEVKQPKPKKEKPAKAKPKKKKDDMEFRPSED